MRPSSSLATAWPGAQSLAYASPWTVSRPRLPMEASTFNRVRANCTRCSCGRAAMRSQRWRDAPACPGAGSSHQAAWYCRVRQQFP